MIEKKKKPMKKESVKREKPLKKDKKATVFEKIDTSAVTPETSSIFLDCSSELEEEEYV